LLHGQIKEGRLFVAWSLHADQINPPPASFKMTFAEISNGVASPRTIPSPAPLPFQGRRFFDERFPRVAQERNPGLSDEIPLGFSKWDEPSSNRLAERGYDGSRGLQPTVGHHARPRRGATHEDSPHISSVAPRRIIRHRRSVD